MSEQAPQKRWRQISLLIAFVALLAACLWGRAQIEWVNERRVVKDIQNVEPDNIIVAVGTGVAATETSPTEPGPVPPWTVRMLGDEGVPMIWIDGRAPAERKTAELARLKGLFPEADVSEAPPQALPIYDKIKAQASVRKGNQDAGP